MIKKIICLSLILSFALSCFSGCGLFAELPFFALEEEVESTVSTEENGDIDEPNEPNGSNDDTSGVKYEIKEERYKFSDIEYIHMSDILRNEEGIRELRKITGLDIDEKMRLFKVLRQRVTCSNLPICKFLHLDITESQHLNH